MLLQPTLEKLEAMKLTGMVKALREQLVLPDMDRLTFEERLGLLVERELTERDSRKLGTRLRGAQLGQQACLEDLDLKAPRGLTPQTVAMLASLKWLESQLNVMSVGPTGTGKSYLGCALGHQACRRGYPTLYIRANTMFKELHQGRLDGSYRRVFHHLGKVKLLIVDDFALSPLTE